MLFDLQGQGCQPQSVSCEGVQPLAVTCGPVPLSLRGGAALKAMQTSGYSNMVVLAYV